MTNNQDLSRVNPQLWVKKDGPSRPVEVSWDPVYHRFQNPSIPSKFNHVAGLRLQWCRDIPPGFGGVEENPKRARVIRISVQIVRNFQRGPVESGDLTSSVTDIETGDFPADAFEFYNISDFHTSHHMGVGSREYSSTYCPRSQETF
jgi:hypothetical protein